MNQRDYFPLKTFWPKSETPITSNVDKDVEHKEHSFIVSGMQNCTSILEDSLSISYKIKHALTVQTSALLGAGFIYSYQMKIYVHTKALISMFMASLLIIAKALKEPVCSVGE